MPTLSGSSNTLDESNQHRGFGPHHPKARGKRMILTDIDGKRWKLHERLRWGQGYEIYPNHSQMNLSKEGGERPTTGLTIPNHIADSWVKGEIKVKVN